MNKIPFAEIVREFLFDKKEHIVIGSSMQPSLNHGQKVMLLPFKNELHIGHIYVFLFKGKLLMHRLIAFSSDNTVFMGDYSYSIEKIHPKNIVAELEYRYCPFLLALIKFINVVCYYVGKLKKIFWVSQKIRVAGLAVIIRRF